MVRKNLKFFAASLIVAMCLAGCYAQDRPNMSVDVEQKTIDTLTKISETNDAFVSDLNMEDL